MRNLWAILKKELHAYFVSPIAYVVFAVFLGLSGYFFFAYTAAFNMQSMHYMRYSYALGEVSINEMIFRPLFYNIGIILLLMMPLFTMRMYAEEKKSGTMELLLTSPLTNTQIIMGKYLGAMAVFGLMILFTIIYPIILFTYGNPELGPVLSGYLGLFLLGGAFISFGCWASSFTENQIVAAVVTFGVLLGFWVIGVLANFNFLGPTFDQILSYTSILSHFDDFVKGVIDTKHVVYYLSLIIFNLALTGQILELK